MEHAKAKKAKKMAKDFMAAAAIEEQMAMASQPDLQPADGYVTPMHRIRNYNLFLRHNIH